MATFHYSAFHIRVTTDLNLNALLSQQGLECSILFAFIRPYPDGTSAHGLRILREEERNADLTAAPVLARSGTMCRYLEKTSITLNRYLYLSLYFMRDRVCIKSHSQTSIILVTLYEFLGKRLRIGRCFVNTSCCNNQP